MTEALGKPAALPEKPAEPAQQALRAVRDIVGWNTVWDGVNHRPYTTCSRNWDLKKFGGFGFWLNDTAINALLASLFDPEQARENLAVVLYGRTPEGNLPCLITGNDAWVDRTQAPLVSFITWQLYQRTGAISLLEEAYPVLAGNNAWLRRVTRRQRQRLARIRLVSRGPGALSRHQARGEGRVLHGQLADARRGALERAHRARSTARMSD